VNWSDFFYMGGYGFYIWGSYLIAFLLLAGEVFFLMRRKKSLSRNGSQHSSNSL